MAVVYDTYVQGGAKFSGNSKKSLKEAIKENPSRVFLYDTSAFGSKFSGCATELPEGMKFNVVGPDPYTRRDWFATIYKGRGGRLVVT